MSTSPSSPEISKPVGPFSLKSSNSTFFFIIISFFSHMSFQETSVTATLVEIGFH